MSAGAMSGDESRQRATQGGKALCSHVFATKRGTRSGVCSAVAVEGGLCRRHSAEARSGLPVGPNGEEEAAEVELLPEANGPGILEPEEPASDAEPGKRQVRPEGVRGQIALDLADRYDQVLNALLLAAAATRTTYVTCPDCGKRHLAPVEDWTARTSAIRLLIESGLGRVRETTGGSFEEELASRLASAGRKPMSAWTDGELELLLEADLAQPSLDAETR